MTAPTIDETVIRELEILLDLPQVDMSNGCPTCGDNSTCQVCGGSGHWHSKKEVQCGHCNGSGNCPK